MRRLTSETIPTAALSAEMLRVLFAIFEQHYRRVSFPQFLADLREKDAVILLRDAATQAPRGFSTQQVLRLTHRGEPLRVLFSGDTIIDRAHWGEQELVRAWCRFAGRVRGQEASRLFWFLISKGHRTYLYLPLFFRAFIPKRDATGTPELTRLRDALACEKFGGAYDPASGVARFLSSRGRLAHPLAEVPPGRADDPDVQFFLAANPGYARGDELVCLAEISPQNMRGLAARMLAEGEAEHA